MTLKLKIFIDNVEADLEAGEIKGTIYLTSIYGNEEYNLKTFIIESIRLLIDDYVTVTSITIKINNSSNSLEVTVISSAPPQTSLPYEQPVTLYLNLNINTSKVSKNINNTFILEEQTLNQLNDGLVEINYTASIQNQISENAKKIATIIVNSIKDIKEILEKTNIQIDITSNDYNKIQTATSQIALGVETLTNVSKKVINNISIFK
jgi:hypothetical protein